MLVMPVPPPLRHRPQLGQGFFLNRIDFLGRLAGMGIGRDPMNQGPKRKAPRAALSKHKQRRAHEQNHQRDAPNEKAGPDALLPHREAREERWWQSGQTARGQKNIHRGFCFKDKNNLDARAGHQCLHKGTKQSILLLQ